MKLLLTLISFTLSLIGMVNAQSNTCGTANPFCSANTYNFPNATSGTAPSGPNYGCLGSQPAPIWYYMEVGTSGPIGISLQQTTGTNGSGTQIDVDFAMWGPFSSLTAGCAAVMGGQAPLQCSFSASYSETIGIGLNGGTGSGNSTPAAAVAGQVYIVLLTNYSGSAGYISFNQTSGTGSADCAIVNPCVISNLTATVSACNPATNTYSVTGNVSVSNAPTTGTLVAQTCDGTTTTIATAPFTASSYPYSITNLAAGGGACDVEVYFSDGACSQILNYTAPSCPQPCSFTNITANIGVCQTGSTFNLTGTLNFVNAPSTGTLVVQDCNGNSATYNAPFTSPLNFAINNISADGAACGVTATFSADPACTINVAYTNAPPCSCTVDVGTFTTSTAGNNSTSPTVLCYGDNIQVNSNGDYIYPTQVTSPPYASGYDPSVVWVVYSCPPTIGLTPSMTDGVGDDPCFVGILTGEDLLETNDLSLLNAVGGTPNNTLYFVPLTMYHTGDLIYSYVNGSVLPCYDMGTPVPVQYLPEIVTTVTPNCQAGTVSVQVSGGSPAINGGNFTASNLTPATASITTNNVANNGTIVVSGLQDGQAYSFDIKDQYGCPVTITGTFQGVTPSGFTYPQNAYCKDAANPTPTITGATGGTFSATSGMVINAVTGVINIASTPAGTYTVTYTSPGAPCNSQTTFVVTINPLPTITVPNVAICNGQTATLNASGANTYSWSPATGLSATTGATVTSNVTANQTYTVTGTVTATGCSNTGTTTVTVNPLPTVSVPNATICSGQTATLTASGANTYTWSPATGLSATTGTSVTSSVTTTQTYTVTGTVTATGCTNTTTVTVTVNPRPTVTIPSATICTGQTATLTATGADTYTWSPATGLNTTVGASVISSVTATQTYTVTGTITATGCSNTGTTTVTVNPLPTITVPSATVCSGNPATLNASGANTYTWSPTTGLSASTGATVTSNVVANQTYTITGTNTATGCSNTGTTTVTVNPLPTPVINGQDEYCIGTTATIQTTTPYSSYSWSNGQNSATAQVTQGNNPITVTVTDANGCTATSAAFTVTENIAITNNLTQAICQGQSVMIHGISRSTAGTYSQTFTSATGCDSVVNVTLTVNPLPTVTIPNTAICIGATATLNASGASTYSWSPATGLSGTTGASVASTVTANQTYTVTGTNTATGCVNTGTVTVTVNPLPTITSTNQTICTGQSATLTANGADTYTWSPATGLSATTGSSVTSTVVSNTTYTITGTNTANGCVNTESVTVTVNSLPTITAANQTICTGQTANLTASGATSYSWSPATGLSATAGASVASSVTANQTYTITGTDGATGCSNTGSVSVTVNPLPTINVGGDQEVCEGTSVTLTAIGAPTISWSPAAQNGVSFVQPVGTQTYVATGTDINGCVNTAQLNVIVNPNPEMNPTQDITVCNNSSVSAVNFSSSVPSSTFAWVANATSIGIASSGNGNISSFVGTNNTSAPISSTVNVTPTSPKGCVGAADEFVITVQHSPTATITGTTAVCLNGQAPTLTVTGANGTAPYIISYTINGGGTQTVTTSGNSATLTVPTNTAGTYVYAITNVQESGNGCAKAITGSATVTVNALPVISAGADVDVCATFPVILSGSGAGSGGSYAWNNNVTNSISFVPSATGTYTVTGTDANGCKNSDDVLVTVNNPTPVNAGPDQTVCIGSSVTLTASSTDPATTFVWNNSVVNGVPFNPTQSKTYVVTATDGNGCVATDDVDVIVRPLPTIDAGANISGCADNQFTLVGSGAGTTGTYTWSHGVQNGVATTLPSGNYYITVIGTDANGCSNSDSLQVKIQEIPNVSFNADQDGICAPAVGTFYNTTGLSNVSCLWSFDDGSTYNGCEDVTHVFNTAGEYGASLIITTSNGCSDTLYQEDLVIVENNPVAHFTFSPTTLTQLSNEVHFVNGSYGASSYDWDFGDEIGTSTLVNPIYKYSENPASYTVTLIAYSAHGCPDTFRTMLEVKEELIFYVPNTFTPDGDQYNETFKPVFTYGYDPFDYTLIIFNRWGEKIFESHDASIGWNGLYGEEGNACQDGTYTWKIDVKTTMSDERKSFIGHVNLLR